MCEDPTADILVALAGEDPTADVLAELESEDPTADILAALTAVPVARAASRSQDPHKLTRQALRVTQRIAEVSSSMAGRAARHSPLASVALAVAPAAALLPDRAAVMAALRVWMFDLPWSRAVWLTTLALIALGMTARPCAGAAHVDAQAAWSLKF